MPSNHFLPSAAAGASILWFLFAQGTGALSGVTGGYTLAEDGSAGDAMWLYHEDGFAGGALSGIDATLGASEPWASLYMEVDE